jgi:hypothetical protein
MSATADVIARRMAERLAPLTDQKLPARVEHVLAEGEERGGTMRSTDPAVIVGLASFLVSLAGLAWTIFSTERARQEQQEAAARAAGQEAKNDAVLVEVAYLRGLLSGRLGAEIEVPRGLPEKVRIAVVETAAEEAVAAGKRERAR